MCRATYPTIWFDRFAILEPQNTFLTGDSVIRQQVVDFCKRILRRRYNYYYPGAGIDDITAGLDEVTADPTNDFCFVLHTSTNGVCKTRSEGLLEKYRRPVEPYNTKSPNVIFSGVLPWM